MAQLAPRELFYIHFDYNISRFQRIPLVYSFAFIFLDRMCYDDFVNEFEKIEMCALGPQSLNMDDTRNKVAFQMTLEHGCWQPGVNAGGCRNFLGMCITYQ